MEVEFKMSEDESYFFVKFDEYSLLIGHTMKRPGKVPESPKIFGGLLEEGGPTYRSWDHQVQISERCVPKFKEFVLSKAGFIKVGKVVEAGMGSYYIDECKDGHNLYHFKITLEELTDKIDTITIYWIQETIDHVEIDLIAIPELIKFLNENF